MKTNRLTTAQALVKFLEQQYIEFDGVEHRFVESIFTLFGHGNAVGLGEALYSNPDALKVMQGRNEQGMCHAAIGFAKQNNRRRIIPCTSSIGPGAANMVTAAATATVNNIPLLLFPGDTFASRQPDPVLQQVEQSWGLSTTTNDAFKPVCKYWDRIVRPEQLMSAMINAMRVLTDPAETGAVCISLPQDTEGEAFDWPEYFFEKRVHHIPRPLPDPNRVADVCRTISESKHPLLIVGGGVKYSEAGEAVEKICEKYHIPFAETQAGKSACKSSHEWCVGGIGTTGTLAANKLAKEADLIIAVGTRLSDFTTASKSQYQNPDAKIVSININRFHAYKMDAEFIVADAKKALEEIDAVLDGLGYVSAYKDEVADVKSQWQAEVDKLTNYAYGDNFKPLIDKLDPRTIDEFVDMYSSTLTQTAAIMAVRETIDDDAIIVTAGGSLPSCLQRLWTTDVKDSYHAEYGYSCMGYEVEAVLGVKLAEPEREVYTLVGDGSFQMMHSEMATAMQERQKVNILVFDNCGFGCINNLEMTHGIGSIATEFRYHDDTFAPTGDLIAVDYAKIAEGFGFKSYTVRTVDELKDALIDAKKQELPVLIDLKIIPKTMTDGYESWWNVGLAEVSSTQSVVDCWQNDVLPGRKIARKY